MVTIAGAPRLNFKGAARLSKAFLWATGLVLAAACVGPLKQWGYEASLVSQAPSFKATMVEHNRVAVLNAVVGFGLEGYSHGVSRSLAKALVQGQHPVEVIPPQASLSRINQSGLAGEYAGMVRDYTHSGILKHDVLEKVGRALEVGYVLQPSLATFTQTISGRFSFFGLRLFQTRVSTMRLSVQLWDARVGEILWEASGEATLAGEDVREYRIPFEEVAQHLWTHILKQLWDSHSEPGKREDKKTTVH